MKFRRPWAVFSIIITTLFATLAASSYEAQYSNNYARSPAAFSTPWVWEVREGDQWYENKVQTVHAFTPSRLGKTPSDLYDVRGVGDSGWTKPGGKIGRSPLALGGGFGAALSKVDPTGKMFRGHLNFINWESVVGTRCEQIRESVDFYFLSHPTALLEAANRGYNLFSFSNNHAQDCDLGKSSEKSPSLHGPLMTLESIRDAANRTKQPLLWNGVGDSNSSDNPYQAKVGTFEIDGKKVRVALGALSLLGWNIPNAATTIFGPSLGRGFNPTEEERRKVGELLLSLQNADADLRILSIHTQDGSGSKREDGAFLYLKEIAERFVTKHNGDIVFGEGPHTWGGVRVFEKPNGRKGVVFTSLGNFIHQGLASNTDNYVARALFSRDDFDLREVQVYPFVNQKTFVEFFATPSLTKEPRANFGWTRVKSELNGKPVTGFTARFR